MNTAMIDFADAAERSAHYAHLARAFSYRGADIEAGIPGPEYNAAFDPSVEEDACSLREGAHAEEEQSALFEELMRFYEFFGLGRSEGAEMPDHLSVELEFMHYLTHLEAQVQAQPDSDPEALDSLWRAQHDFLTRHVWRVVHAVQDKLNSEHPACVALVEGCSAFVQEELMRARQRLAN